jgi:hypothetical protein
MPRSLGYSALRSIPLLEPREEYYWLNPALQVVTYAIGQTITTPLLPDVSISVDDLFR